MRSVRRSRLAQSGDAPYDKVEMMRGTDFPPCRGIARTLAARVGDPGISIAEGGASEVGMGGDPLAYLVELFVAPRIVEAAF